MPSNRSGAAYDEVVITVEGGRGGDGCVAFHREKFVQRGGPSGGDGGRGGDVVLVGAEDVHGFAAFRGRKKMRAKNGRPGGPRKRHGADADELVIPLPVGTEVRDAETDVLLKDLTSTETRVRIVEGGAGGKGNARFAKATRQTPRFAEKGKDGASRRLRLSLKLIADAGLVGLPNAGKSTLLARLTRSKTRSAGYRFTTLAPHLGVVDLGPASRITFADLPGLVEGAHTGRGLGHEFLKHVERTRVLVHVVAHDPSGGSPPPEEAYRTIREELERYSPKLAAKPEIVVLSKVDLGGFEESLNSLGREADSKVSAISAVSGIGLHELLVRVARALDRDEGDVEFA